MLECDIWNTTLYEIRNRAFVKGESIIDQRISLIEDMNALLATAYGSGDMKAHYEQLKSSVLVVTSSTDRMAQTDDDVFNKILEMTCE